MSTAAVSSAMTRSSLNPNAPLFIPAAVRQVEDFSPEWWELVKTTAWFRDHWFREHQEQETFDGEDEDEDEDDVVDLLPDSFDLGIPDDEFDQAVFGQAEQEPAPKAKAGLESAAESLVRSLSLKSPKNGATKPVLEPAKLREKPAQCVSPKFSPRRIIHQPR